MAMIPPYRDAPTLRPMPPHLLEELQPAARTHTPSERGYLDSYPIGDAPHHEEVQKMLVKLFFARYMSVSDDQIEAAIGHDNNPFVNRESYRQERRSLLEFEWMVIRARIFGEDGFFDKLVKHTVEKYDFEVTVYELARSECIFQQVPLNETAIDRTTREANLIEFSQAKADHISRYSLPRRQALEQAQKGLQQLKSASISQRTEYQRKTHQNLVDWATRLVNHHKAHNAPWPSTPPNHAAASCPLPYYRDLSTKAVQQFWQSLWSLDVGTNMLWEVHNVIDIPATLQHAGHIYKTAFVVFCVEAWQKCLAISSESTRLTKTLAKAGYSNVRVEMRQDRKAFYRHVGGASVKYWPREPGLDLLRISAGGPNSAKRKADVLGPALAGLKFTKK
jgi:hypothetical protein